MKKIFTNIVVAATFYLPQIALAQATNVPQIPNPLKGGVNSLYTFINLVLNDVVIPIGAVICVLAIIYSGFMIVTARGDESKLKAGKMAFLTAVIGTAILLGSVAISKGIEATINQIKQ